MKKQTRKKTKTKRKTAHERQAQTIHEPLAQPNLQCARILRHHHTLILLPSESGAGPDKV